jgi:hypothetical protein
MLSKLTGALLLILCCSSFIQTGDGLKGTYEFKGGIYNGKKEGAPAEYKLQRKYKADNFDAFLLEKGEKPQKYQSGKYELKPDSCFETETYSAQPSKLTGVTLKYHYILRNDTLIFQGILPTGMVVEEYWKKVK